MMARRSKSFRSTPRSVIRAGDADPLAQAHHRVEIGIECRRKPHVTSERRNWRFDGRPVEPHDVGHQHRIGQAVLRIVERSDRMAERMHRSKPLDEDVAPMIAAAIIYDRATMSEPSSTARGSQSWHILTPTAPIASAIG